MKGRGIALFAVLIVVVVGGIVFWKMRGSDKRATPAVTHASGSAAAKPSTPTAAKTARASVTVTDDKGPVADAFVRFAPEDGEIIAVKTGANGVAVADKLATGAYEISASAAGHEPSCHGKSSLRVMMRSSRSR